MDLGLTIAAILATCVGIAHSWLGERYILTRLFRRTELPHLFGSDQFTRRTLRFAWHLTSVAWWGFAALLLALAQRDGGDLRAQALLVIAGTFAVHALVTAIASRGRHLAWLVFTAIAVLAWLAIGP